MTLEEFLDVRDNYKELTIVVTGGRSYNNIENVYRVLSEIKPYQIIQGGATGADFLAARFASDRGIWCGEVMAEWSKYGRAAGPIRNRKMLMRVPNCVLVAFPGGSGTRNCVETAKELRIPVIEIEEPKDEFL